jgi:hypothetical protein
LQVVFMIVLFGLMGLFGLAIFGGVMFLSTSRHPAPVAIVDSHPITPLEDQLPSHANDVSDVYEKIDKGLHNGVQRSEVTAPRTVDRVDLVPEALLMLQKQTDKYWEQQVVRGLRPQDARRIQKKFGQLNTAFFCVESTQPDLDVATGIVESLGVEAPKFKLRTAIWNADRISKVQGLLTYVSDASALHRELAMLDAQQGDLPTVIVAVTVDRDQQRNLLRLRVIYPGKEALLTIPFALAEAPAPAGD